MSKNKKLGVARYIGLALGFLVALGLVLTLGSGTAVKAVSPSVSSFWSDFSGTTLHNINNNYTSIIYDTNNNGLCETADLTGATQVAVSPKGSWLANTYLINGASLSLGFTMPDPSFRDRGLCLRYYSSGYYIEPANAFFYQAEPPVTSVIALSSASIRELVGYKLSSSLSSASFSVFASMTAGDILISIFLFGLIMLGLLGIFLKKV